ncbi:HotDog domain-containing protein [Exophiala viscosa]|uniref:HotDog domain-containing protein n=1 Tax=Exophiala viscosa TaxID=2486360 RepID=UPI00218E22A8|nr:HotDog domain-containing protein [Exophiala viscosa]
MAVNPSDIPVQNSSGRYDNVDFKKATGFEYPPIKCSYNRRDVLIFANAIGIPSEELHFMYELDPHFSVFPTFASNLAFKQTDHDVFDFIQRTTTTPVPGVPPADPQRSVDGERGIEIVRPLPTSSEGLDLEIRGKVLGVYDRGGNMILEAEQSLLDVKTNTVYTKMSSTAFCVGQGGYGGPRGQSKPVIKVPETKPDAVHLYNTLPEQAALYRLCGDYNPLHADGEFGKRAGFKGKILQGLCTWNIAAHGILQKLGGSDPSRFKSFTARFKSVVYPGDILETRMWKTSTHTDLEHINFETIVKGDGRVALSNGYAILRRPGGHSSKI